MRTGTRTGRLFLASSALGALNTVNAYKPLSRAGPQSLPVMAAAVPTSELPLHAIGWQAVATAAFASRGALGSKSGRLGLGITIASWGALVGLYRAAQGSRDVLDAALRDELGASYVDAIRDRLGPTPDLPLSRRQIALPSRGARKRYASARDIAYGDAGVRNHLDIWRRADLPSDGRAPVLLQVHGGGWVMGRKEDQAGPLLTHMAEQGWVCVAMNYRLSPKATWPDQIADVKRALMWIRSSIADYGGDPSFVAITGGSAGGHLSALAALSPGDPAFQPGFEEADTAVQAAVPMYGLFDLTGLSGATRPDTIDFLQRYVLKSSPADEPERWWAASPLCRLRADAPPFFVVHGTNDAFLPVEQARAFVEALRKESTSPVAFAELPRAQHAFDFFSSPRVHHTVHAVGRFLTYVHNTR